MSRTLRTNHPRLVRRSRRKRRTPLPAVAADGKQAPDLRRETGYFRWLSRRKYRAQCKDAMRKGRELPLLPATQGWLSW